MSRRLRGWVEWCWNAQEQSCCGGCLPALGCMASGTGGNLWGVRRTHSLSNTVGTFWFYLGVFGGKEEGIGVFLLCFTWESECERKILNRGSFCFASWMFYTWSDENLISDLSSPWANILVCILFRWRFTSLALDNVWENSRFFSSLSMTAAGSCRNPKKAQYIEGVGLRWPSRTTVWLWLAALVGMVFSLTSTFSSWLILSEVALKERNSYQWLWNLRQTCHWK